MKVRIDPDLCAGCGICIDLCSVFHMEHGIAVVDATDVPADAETECEDAAAACPCSAIIIEK